MRASLFVAGNCGAQTTGGTADPAKVHARDEYPQQRIAQFRIRLRISVTAVDGLEVAEIAVQKPPVDALCNRRRGIELAHARLASEIPAIARGRVAPRRLTIGLPESLNETAAVRSGSNPSHLIGLGPARDRPAKALCRLSSAHGALRASAGPTPATTLRRSSSLPARHTAGSPSSSLARSRSLSSWRRFCGRAADELSRSRRDGRPGTAWRPDAGTDAGSS